ncbi:helix-turn-helix transcriptional regulator [Burkholderia gladioli]|uniref:helix-turn-helix transcriptional regulator n=1 Tax=Burkholderia gladioli TaxID=28095 RepID=UPI00163E04D9|nr:hypothetical protein [Burkholderia gladioli]
MKKQIDVDFRVTFAKMDPQAVIGREELASLLNRSVGAISLLAHRGRLPQTAFPGERKAVWFVEDIREWLAGVRASRPDAGMLAVASEQAVKSPRYRRIGRPRSEEQ